jgi:DNA-binding SARP family transcriptional activator
MRVRLVGPLTVEIEGAELSGSDLGGARERRLLSILAAANGTVVPKDALIERLWHRPPQRPAAAVDTAVSILRRSLGQLGAAIETRRPGYRLEATTDLAELDRLTKVRRWEDALPLASGELLAGEPPSEWVDDLRRAFTRQRITILVHAAQAAAQRGDDQLALERFEAALGHDQLREDAHCGVITALARLGRNAEALRAYEHCRRVLREELGVDPGPEVTAAYEHVVAGRPPRREPHGAAGTSSSPDTLEFLGRRTELARLTAPVHGCRVRIVLGEPGIGKTRLLAEAAAAMPDRQPRSVSCFRLVTPVPRSVLAQLAPELLGPRTDAPLPPEAEASRLAKRWLAVLDRRPTTLVIDDLPWADEPSLVVLGLLLRERPEELLVMVGARDAELDPRGAAAQFVDLAARLELLETVRLGPLTAAEVMDGGLSFHDWEASGGHPLFLTELRHGATGADLAALVLGRAESGGPEATDLLRATAILGRPAPLSDLAALAELPMAAARRTARSLAVAGLLVEVGGEWQPRHDVIAELIHDELGPAARRTWHGRAFALLQTRQADPAELAHHAFVCGAWDACLRHSLEAADRALAAFANREAVAHYRRALDSLARRDPGAPDARASRRRAILGAARASIVLARTDEALALLAQLPEGSAREEAERLLLLADCGWAAWKPSKAIEPAERALSIARDLDDDELEARVHAFIANPYGSLGELDLATQHIDAAVAISGRTKRPLPAVVMYRRALIQHQLGEEQASLDSLDVCRSLATEQHDERTLVFERVVRSWVLGALGRYGEAIAALDDVRHIGRGEEAVVRGRIPNTRAAHLFDLGLVEEALDADEESLEIVNRDAGSGVLEPRIHTLLNLATDHLSLGDPDRAAACLDEVRLLSDEAEYARFRYMNRLHWTNGLLALEAGEIDLALEAAGETEAMADRYRAPKYRVRSHLLRGMALARAGRDTTLATNELRAASQLADRHRFAALAARCHEAAAELTGSARHARAAAVWRSRIAASVDAPLRDRL